MRHTNQSPGTTGSVLENAAQIERALIRQEFQRQPARVQTETIERILSILVDEYRRRPNVHSALWKNMDVYGFNEKFIQFNAEYGRKG